MSLIRVDKTDDFPIEAQQRKCTDLCCMVFGVAFTALLLLLSFILSNPDHLVRTSFPADSQGKVCGFDLPQYPYIYFTDLPDIKNRVCVSQCPIKTDKALKCVQTENIGCMFNNDPKFRVSFYESTAETTSIGSFCTPTDNAVKEKLYEDIDVAQRFTFFERLDSIVLSCLIGLGLCLIFTLLVQQMPRRMTKYTLGFGCLILVIMAIFILVFPQSYIAARIIFSILLIVLVITIFLNWRKNKNKVAVYGEFAHHATEVVSSQKLMVIYIPIFLGILVVFILMILFELERLWSSAPIYFHQNKVYHQFQHGSTTFWSFLVFVQAVWGLSFIKEAFNFIVAGNAVEWYYSRVNQSNQHTSVFLPLKYLFTSHFGSVVAGSFMNGWFSVPDFIFDNLRSEESQGEGRCARCLYALDDFFDLVRSDAMAYVYLTGNPYCNSSRYCEYLCQHSSITSGSQSISRSYRICAHFLLAGLIAVLNISLQGTRTSVFLVLVVFILGLFIGTFFISLHADATEAIQIIFLMDQYFATKDLPADQRQNLNQEIIQKMKLNRIKQIAPEISKLSSRVEQNP